MTDAAPEPDSKFDAKPEPTGFDFNQPTIVALCYLASAVSGLPMLIGLVLAYVWQGAPEHEWENSHFRFHIRTFWIGIALGLLLLIPTILTLGVAGWLLYPLLGLWLIIRSLIALLKAQKREPIVNVTTWAW